MSEARRILTLCLLCVALVIVSSLGLAKDPPDFSAQLSQAEHSMLYEPAKSYYEKRFNTAFHERFTGWLNKCIQQEGQGLTDLDLLITLDPEGKVTELRIRPETGHTECLAEHGRKEPFPEPPAGRGLVVPVSFRARPAPVIKPQPSTSASPCVPIGGPIKEPRLTKGSRYMRIPKGAKVTGEVVLVYDGVIAETGELRDVRLVSELPERAGYAELDRDFREQLSNRRFSKTLVDGKPVALCYRLRVSVSGGRE